MLDNIAQVGYNNNRKGEVKNLRKKGSMKMTTAEMKKYFMDQTANCNAIQGENADALKIIYRVTWKAAQIIQDHCSVVRDIHMCRDEYSTREEFEQLIADLRADYTAADESGKLDALETIMFDLREIERAEYMD